MTTKNYNRNRAGGNKNVNIKTVEKIAKNPETQWYLNIKETAVILGCTYQSASKFLKIHSVPSHKITGKSKSYFLDDVLTAVEKTKWKSS